MTLRRQTAAAVLAIGGAVALAVPSAAQTTTAPAAPPGAGSCPAFESLPTCDGFVTDGAGVLADAGRVERAAARFVSEFGHQIALVTVEDAPGGAEDFARRLGDAWGVGDADRNDGIVVVVDLGASRTGLVWGPGLDGELFDGDALTSAADGFFADGDVDGGLVAILTAIDQQLSAAGDAAPVAPLSPTGPPSGSNGDDGGSGGGATRLVVLGALFGGGALFLNRRHRRRVGHRRRVTEQQRRERLVDAELARLEIAGHELPRLDDYARPDPTATPPPIATGTALAAVGTLLERRVPADEATLPNLHHRDLVDVVDTERLAADTEVPLELRVTGERDVLDDGTQDLARAALDVPIDDGTTFDIRLGELNTLVDAVRPHRVAEARRRAGALLMDHLVTTPLGATAVTDRGERFHRAGAVLDADAPLADELTRIDASYAEAEAKTARMVDLYGRLPDSTARPAVAAALADVDLDAGASVEVYERVRSRLAADSGITGDGLDPAALAALLVLNRDEDDVDDFVTAYRSNRNRGLSAGESVEYTLAGLAGSAEIERVRRAAAQRGVPVAIAAALLRRRDDGFEVLDELLADLAAHDVTGDTLRTIAGVLAVSLEPAQAERRWLAARQALHALGLQGAYADVAAAFGASDPRGPDGFALAYAAQRQSLARSEIDDADRFAAELAHDGTSQRNDTWTGHPIPRGLGTFDPFTLFFFHWMLTGGDRDAVGWEPIYRDESWSGDGDSWSSGGGFGGFGGGGVTGGGGGGSNWGGGGWGGSLGGGGFGGFGGGSFGGGGFDGGDGGGGGSSW